jgi:hypothetical protein
VEQQQQQGLSVTAEDLYAVIGQLTIENRVLRARLRALEQQAAQRNGAGPGAPTWRDVVPAGDDIRGAAPLEPAAAP